MNDAPCVCVSRGQTLAEPTRETAWCNALKFQVQAHGLLNYTSSLDDVPGALLAVSVSVSAKSELSG